MTIELAYRGLSNNAPQILKAMEAGEYVSFEHGYFKMEADRGLVYCSLQELKEEIKSQRSGVELLTLEKNGLLK